MNTRLLGAGVVAGLALGGCTRHQVQTQSEVDVKPIRVEPIHITLDINLRVDRQLDSFFEFEEKAGQSAQ